MAAWGVDGCRTGWFWFRLDGDRHRCGIAATFDTLVAKLRARDRLSVDIPIGLLEGERPDRVCDREARKVLGPRRSSVFPAPTRSALAAKGYSDACAINFELTGRKISKQAWNIGPKIAEVDAILLDSVFARARVRETHPEVCFWAFAGGRPMSHYKKSREGFRERMAVLGRINPQSSVIIAEAFLWFADQGVARDDVVDAFVVAETARRSRRALRTLPTQPRTDSRGLPMEMIYPAF